MIYKIKQFIRGRYNISFSKSGDDIQLMKLINQTQPGAYVDIGCWDPIKSSNTYYFYLRNWKGICIDPNPELKNLYKQFRPKDIFINSGIGSSNIYLDYYMFEESSMNSFSSDFVLKHKDTLKIINKVNMPLYTLEEVLERNDISKWRLDFFDIDAEGFDLEVLKTNNWNKFRPKIIVIESDLSIEEDIHSEITIYLKEHDYKFLGKSIISNNLGNLFFITN